MITRLEMELQEARDECEALMRALRYSNLARWFAADERKTFLNGFSYLLNRIDEIANLVVSAKNLIRESRAIRAMLFHGGLRSCSPKLVQLISNESVIAEELLLIQEMKNEKVTWIGELLIEYNDYLRQLLEMRVAGSGRMWMNLGGVPAADYFPPSLNLHLLSEFYEDDGQLIHHPPATMKKNPHLPGRNGRSR